MKRRILIVVIAVLALALLLALGFYLSAGSSPAPADAETAESGADAPAQAERSDDPMPEPEDYPPGDPQGGAAQLTLTTDAPAVAARRLLDGNYTSDYSFPAGTELTLTAEEPIDSLYIIFGSYPGEWTLRSGGGEQLCGQDGFLHEFVKLESPAESVQICLGDEEVLIRDVYAFSDGYLPSFVQTWQRLEGGADILIFSTHYDDELLFMGGLIPYYSVLRGLRVQVCYMTSNYLTDFSNYRFRPHEALNGLWVCGDHFYPVTNEVPDYECPTLWDATFHYGEDQFCEFQTEMIRRFKPLVVVTQARDGEYGHGAHILTALSVERAVEAAADPAQFPDSAEKYGLWDTPKTYLHYYGDPDDITWISYELRAAEFGWKNSFQIAQDAYRQHLTQQQWEGFYVYGYGHPFDSHRFGLYRTLVGRDEKHDDLMEHVSREDFPIE